MSEGRGPGEGIRREGEGVGEGSHGPEYKSPIAQREQADKAAGNPKELDSDAADPGRFAARTPLGCFRLAPE